jgi:plasmid replication initiation protein
MSQKTTSLLEVMKTSDSIEEWEKFFSLSMIGRADREYRELKKLISTARNAQKK